MLRGEGQKSKLKLREVNQFVQIQHMVNGRLEI